MTAPLNHHQGRREAILLAHQVLNGNPSNGTANLLQVARWIYYGDDPPVPYLPTPYGLQAPGKITITNGTAS